MTCCFRWPCARIVASQARRAVSLRRRSVLEGCRASGSCDPGVVLRCPAWQARGSVCAGAVFVGPVVQSARFGELEACQNWSISFWRHSPVLVLDACRKRVKVGFRGRSSSLHDFDFVASLLRSFSCKFRGRRSTFAPGCGFRGRHVTLTQRDRSCCGAVRTWSQKCRSEVSITSVQYKVSFGRLDVSFRSVDQ